MERDPWPPAREPDPHVFTDARCRLWTEKGRRLAAEYLPLAGAAARPAAIRHESVSDPSRWPYGRFMGAWLDDSTDPRVLRHLPSAEFFMRLLAVAYEPEFRDRPDRVALLAGTSRLQVSLTNDALQIQLATLASGYSMIRHHALMLFEATLWLDQPERTKWLELYEDLAIAHARSDRGDLSALADIETGAFEDFVELAPRTIDQDDAIDLLSDHECLSRILQYQRCAGVAIGLLWSNYRELPAADQVRWHAHHLSCGYLEPDYLEKEWTGL